MPYKDTAADREYHRDLMRRRRADGSAAEPKPPPGPGVIPPASSDAALASQAQQNTAADRRTPDPGPRNSKKCVWSDKDICILFLSQNFKPIRCYGYNRLCEGKPEDINTIPFKQCRENNEKTTQLAL